MTLQIILTATEPQLAQAWQQRCGDLPNVTIHFGSILDLTCDAVVSPANSFGFMDGGIDLIYTRFFGTAVEQDLQQHIQSEYAGELLVGQAALVATQHATIPYLVAAPTMRTPTRLVSNTIHPFLAARAVLLLWQNGLIPEGRHKGELIANHISRIAFPGLGTGIGGVAAQQCAQQVRVAIEDVLLAPRPFPQTWSDIQIHQQRLEK